MIKSELIAGLASKMNHIPEHKIADAVNTIINAMSATLIQGSRIEIRDFGSFSVNLRKPRNAHNPRTGEQVVTDSKRIPHFKPGKALRERVNESREKYPIVESGDRLT